MLNISCDLTAEAEEEGVSYRLMGQQGVHMLQHVHSRRPVLRIHIIPQHGDVAVQVAKSAGQEVAQAGDIVQTPIQGPRCAPVHTAIA